MAEQGACDVRAKECKPCGRQMRAKNQRSGQRREKNLDGRIEDKNKKQEVGIGRSDHAPACAFTGVLTPAQHCLPLR